MDGPIDTAALVRCSACRTVYKQPESSNGEADRAGCPECEETVWIAAEIPVPETAERAAA